MKTDVDNYVKQCNIYQHSKHSHTPQAVTEVIADREAHLQLLKKRLEQAQNRMKLQANKNLIDRQFSVGDEVLLKL